MAQTLLAAGYSPDTLKVLLGGWSAWQAAGYPTETSALPPGAQPIPGAPGATVEIVVATVPPAAGTPTP